MQVYNINGTGKALMVTAIFRNTSIQATRMSFRLKKTAPKIKHTKFKDQNFVRGAGKEGTLTNCNG